MTILDILTIIGWWLLIVACLSVTMLISAVALGTALAIISWFYDWLNL